MNKKIVIIGPECSGKSELSKQLSKYYNTLYIEEYARKYIENLKRKYRYTDVLHIAKTQISESKKLNHEIVFFDTDLIITKVWLLHVYNFCPIWVNNAINNLKPDLYLLCYPDITWKSDKVRENGNNRLFFYNWYKEEIKKINVPFKIIKGKGIARRESAIAAINNFL